MSEKRIIAYLAEKCLNEKGQEAVAEFLSDNKIDCAKNYTRFSMLIRKKLPEFAK
jgi:hypothetical protein